MRAAVAKGLNLAVSPQIPTLFRGREARARAAGRVHGTEWRYKKTPQKEFEKLRPDDFDDLIALESVRLL
jgi:hypothetical protein